MLLSFYLLAQSVVIIWRLQDNFLLVAFLLQTSSAWFCPNNFLTKRRDFTSDIFQSNILEIENYKVTQYQKYKTIFLHWTQVSVWITSQSLSLYLFIFFFFIFYNCSLLMFESQVNLFLAPFYPASAHCLCFWPQMFFLILWLQLTTIIFLILWKF